MRILGIAGTKQSGKDSLAKYVLGHKMKSLDLIDSFSVDEFGKLFMNYELKDGKGHVDTGIAEFNPYVPNPNVQNYLANYVDPFVRIFHFADPLKILINKFFGIPYELLNGTDDDKNTVTELLWEKFETIIPKIVERGKGSGSKMTIRDLLQNYAKIMTEIDSCCFIRALEADINHVNSDLTIIADVRREVEVDWINSQENGKVIYLQRKIHDDKTLVETEIEKVDKSKFVAVIDNNKMDITTKNEAGLQVIKDLGWI